MEKYNYLLYRKYKTYSPKIKHGQELILASASNFVRLFAGCLCLNLARCKNSFCGYKFNHKNFFAVGFTNRSATTSFREVKSINPYIPAKTVQRSLQNQGTYFYRVKPQEFFSFSHFYFEFIDIFH